MTLEIHKSESRISDADLRKVEELIGAELPDQYRMFLLDHNGGKPKPRFFKYMDKQGAYTDSLVDWFLSIYEGQHHNFMKAFDNCKTKGNLLPSELIPIADDPFGNLICISVSGTNRGFVYFWDHEQVTDPPNYDNVYLISERFQDFINNLSEQDIPVETEPQRVLRMNDIEGLKVLLDFDWNINSKDANGNTLIENAAMFNRVEMFRYLLQNGAYLGRSLEFANRLNRVEIIRLIQENGF